MALYQPIVDALMDLLEDECGTTFKYYNRKMVTWEALQQMFQGGNDSAQKFLQPALLLYDGPGMGGGMVTYVQAGRTPGNRTKKVTLVIYAQTPGGGTPGGPGFDIPGTDIFYPLIEAVEAALEPDPSDSFGTVSLGGLVRHCWIEGDGVLIPGDIDPNGQGMATLPVSILIP